MTIKAAELQVVIGADTTPAVSVIQRAMGSIGSVAGVALGVFTGTLLTGAVSGLASLGGQALQSYASFERLGASLQSLAAREMLNSGQAADMTTAMAQAAGTAQELQNWIQKLAVESPFTQEGVAQAFRTSMAYGFTTDEAKRLTKAMIDFAAGSGASAGAMDSIALALGQIKAKGKLAGQEVLQLVNAGLPVTQILAKAFGTTTAEVQTLMEKGLIPADEAIEAITQSLERDFGGAAKRQAGTFSGLLSSLQDIKAVGLRELFTGVFQAAQPALQKIVDLLSSDAFMTGLRSFGEQIGGFVSRVVEVMAGVDWAGLFGRFSSGVAEASGWIQTSLLPAIQQITVWIAENLVPAIQAVSGWFSANLPAAFAAFGAFYQQYVQPVLQTIAQYFQTVFPQVIAFFAGVWSGVLLPILTVLGDILQNILWPVLSAIAELLLSVLSVAFEAVVGAIQNLVLPALEQLWIFINNSILPLITQLVTWLVVNLKPAFDVVAAAVARVVEFIEKMAAAIRSIKLPDWLKMHSPPPLATGLEMIAEGFRQSAAEAAALNTMLQRQIVPAYAMTPSAMVQGQPQTVYNVSISAADAVLDENGLITALRRMEFLYG